MTVAFFRNGGAFVYRKYGTSMGVDSIRTNVRLVQHLARNTSFLKSLIKINIVKT